MNQALSAEPRWTIRLSKWALRLAVTALLLAAAGLLLGRYDLVSKMVGFGGLAIGALVAVLGALVALAAVVANLRTKAGLMSTALIGLFLSVGFLGWVTSLAQAGSKVPPIHDISTDLANPPAFAKLALRKDNLAGVETVEKWRELHVKANPDIKPIVIAKPVAAVIADADRLAKERGWDVALADGNAGAFEATESVWLIRFQDDVVIRAVPTADGKGTTVDMRSVSRVGVSDFGLNAKRVREFLAALSAA